MVPFDRDDRDDSSGFTGKRKKSWRELDAQRGKKGQYASRQEDREQEKISRSPTYARYKAAADSLFTGGELPEELAKKFDPDGSRKAQKEALLKLQQMPDHKAWVQGVVEYLEKYPELPEDPYFLDSLLNHPRDRIVDKALARLEVLETDGKLRAKLPKSLEQHLKSLELTSMDPEVQQRAKALREKVRAY